MSAGTIEEAKAAGINIECPMMSERRPGAAGQWRVHDGLVTRRPSGGITHAFGYFTPEQVAARKAWFDRLAREVGPIFGKYQQP